MSTKITIRKVSGLVLVTALIGLFVFPNPFYWHEQRTVSLAIPVGTYLTVVIGGIGLVPP